MVLATCAAEVTGDNPEQRGRDVLDRFADLLRTPLYVGLLEHRAAQLGPVRRAGDAVHLEVLVLTKDDRTQGFTWVLGRQGGPPHQGCWLTDGVLRHPDPEVPS